MVQSSDRSDIIIRKSYSHGQNRGDEHNIRSADKKDGRQQQHDDASTISTTVRQEVNHHQSPSSRSYSKKVNGDDVSSLPCNNRAHSFYPEWTGQECDHESFFCFSEGINNHCCKCRPECCGQCNVTATNNDPYHACPSMIDERLGNGGGDFEEDTKIIVLSVIVVVLGLVLGLSILYYRASSKRKQAEADPDYDKKKNLQEFRDDEYGSDGSEGRFENSVRTTSDGIRTHKSS